MSDESFKEFTVEVRKGYIVTSYACEYGSFIISAPSLEIARDIAKALDEEDVDSRIQDDWEW